MTTPKKYRIEHSLTHSNIFHMLSSKLDRDLWSLRAHRLGRRIRPSVTGAFHIQLITDAMLVPSNSSKPRLDRLAYDFKWAIYDRITDVLSTNEPKLIGPTTAVPQ